MFLTSVYDRQCLMPRKSIEYTNAFNKVLEEEKSGYRFVENKALNITNSAELELLGNVTHSKFESVNIHFKKAIDLYSDRVSPDYENTIKESISAVEALCCIITGSDGANSSLGKTLKKLKENGIYIHPALENAFQVCMDIRLMKMELGMEELILRTHQKKMQNICCYHARHL